MQDGGTWDCLQSLLENVLELIIFVQDEDTAVVIDVMAGQMYNAEWILFCWDISKSAVVARVRI